MNKKKLKNVIFLICTIAAILLVAANIFFYRKALDKPVLFLRIIALLAFPLFLKFTFYMLLGPWYKVAELIREKKYLHKKYVPRVSVLVPAWNEEVGIIKTIKSVCDSDYDNLEIIVINDGSTDSTDRCVREFIDKRGINRIGPDLIYHYQENSGKSGALNRGISLASGEIVITIDADSIIKKNTVSRFVEHFKDPEVMCVGGNIVVGNRNCLLGTIQALEFLISFYIKQSDSLMNGVYVVGGAAAAYRREVFKKTGLFNVDSITEDIDMSMKIQDLGYKILYAADAVVVTEGAGTMEGLLKQRLRWKRGRFDTFFRFKKMFFSTNPVHNKFLTLLILPFGLLAEIQLFFELLFLLVVYIYSFLTLNFTILLISAAISGSIFLVMALFGSGKPRPWLLPYAVIGWGLFYLATFVEYTALIRTLWSLANKQTVEWQSWQRQGVLEDE